MNNECVREAGANKSSTKRVSTSKSALAEHKPLVPWIYALHTDAVVQEQPAQMYIMTLLTRQTERLGVSDGQGKRVAFHGWIIARPPQKICSPIAEQEWWWWAFSVSGMLRHGLCRPLHFSRVASRGMPPVPDSSRPPPPPVLHRRRRRRPPVAWLQEEHAWKLQHIDHLPEFSRDLNGRPAWRRN